MKLSKEKQQHLIIVVVGTVVVVVALYFLLISRFQGSIAKLDKAINEANTALGTANKAIADEKYRLPELARLTNLLSQVESGMLPTNEVFLTFRSSFNQFVRSKYAERIEIVDISKEKLMPVRMYDRFPYSTAVFTIRGWARYHDLGQFIADFETSYPYYRISQVSINSQVQEMVKPETLAFDLDVVALIRPTP